MSSNENDEMSKLRRAIENQRIKAERVDILSKVQANGGYPYNDQNTTQNSSGSPETENVYPVFVPPEQDNWSPSPTGSTLTRNIISPNSSINKRVSSGSLSSVSSHISGSSSSTGSSGPEIEAAMKQSKKKRWQLPLKSAFSKGSKSQSSSQPDLLDSEDSGCPLSPTLSRRNLHTNGSVGSTAESEAIQELLQVVQEKERKLTDVRLEALTSQHQIHQLREQITQMQSEMQILRMENERLQAATGSNNNTNVIDERMYAPAHTTSKLLSRTSSSGVISGISRGTNARVSTRSLSCNQTPVSSPLHRPKYTCKIPTAFDTNFPPLDCRNLQNTLSPDSESEGFQVRFVVTSSSSMLPGKRSVVIGSLPVPRRATWTELDQIAQTVLSEYCRVIDGEARLRITSESIDSYQVGDLRRDIDGKTPDLLPCAYIVGDVDSVEIKLKDPSKGCTDQMAFDMLISKDTLECYVSILLQHRRIILQGPVGTGKTSFAMSLSEYLVARLRTDGGNTMVSVLDALQDGEEKLRKNINDLASRSKTVGSPSLPAVLVVENLHLMSSPTNTLDHLASLCGSEGISPYIIGTMQPTSGQHAEQHNDFRLISCACDSPHVQGYLTRALRRSMVEHILTSPPTTERENDKLSSVVLWIPLCWQHINQFLETHNVQEASIGPKMFLKTPMSVKSSCSWFVGLWNRTIVPHLTSATKYARRCATSWEDPSKWVINGFPWDSCETGINPMKSLNRLEAPEIQPNLPSYPGSPTDVVDGEVEDLPLPPPPVPVRSPTRTLLGPYATSSPIRDTSNGAFRNGQNGCLNNSSNAKNNANIWQRQNGSTTLNRTHSPSPNRHFNTVGSNKCQKYTRSDSAGVTTVEDPLKSMLAQLKQSALSTTDDFNVARSHF